MRDFVYEEERIYLLSDSCDVLAEITFPLNSDNVHVIDHTFVDKSLEGQGIGKDLVLAAAKYLRKNNKKAIAKCPFAHFWFHKHPEYSDILV